MKELILIADWCYNNPPIGSGYEQEFIGSIPKNERDNNSWWYLHGKLENFVHYDKATAINCKTLGISKPSPDWSCISGNEIVEFHSTEPVWRMHFEGIIPVKILGIDKPCVGYFWIGDERKIYHNGKHVGEVWHQCGLVCFKDDIESIKYIKEKFEKRSRWI